MAVLGMSGSSSRRPSGPRRGAPWLGVARLSVVRTSVVVSALVPLLLLPTLALAAGPTTERVPIDETFDDEFLSEVCGVPVVTTATGSFTIRSFERDETGAIVVFTVNIGLTATSPYGIAKFRDVGADIYRIGSDGSLTALIAGQVPFEFAGSELRDEITGEILRAPRDRSDWQLAKVCGSLTGR
jgi:hypothetical protein